MPWLAYEGVDSKLSAMAELAATRELHGIAVSPVTFAPEPGAFALGLAALSSLLGMARPFRGA